MTQSHNPPAVVMKAFTWAYEELGLTPQEAAQILGISEPALKETALVGFEADSPESEVQVAFIKMYHLLYAMSDGDTDLMLDWFAHHNPHLDVTPKNACNNLAGISYVSDYLQSTHGDKPLMELSFVMPRSTEQAEVEMVAR
ncbi:helix-turn-helix domain-containing protein [Salinimonas sediminis]|uniref:DUF2384 domain-containing protein n=1 Tax=Salinimonas sediminis TaxID=2303538 RepID=A0A346NHU7_9ALTE|nr:hypothetical protein [Salinimonas sediminis]AXR05104.1 hypothetical protein D0Y50_01200 [Salinimonas sediminis]